MTKWPSKFYYIEFNKEVMPEVMEIRYYKHNLIEEPFKLIRDLELTVGSKLTEQIVEKTDNFDSVIQDLFYRGKEKFKKQPGIEKINITELYEFDSFINLLKKLNIYNPKNLKIIKSRWQEFYNKNKYFIKKIQNKYSHNEN